MIILADENIPFVKEVFSPLGEVRTLSGRAMTREAVRDAELLLVRSVTKIGRDLLDGSRVRFVATATIGFDHVDRAYLDSHGICFASAPGSNARSVAEYIVSALLHLEARSMLSLSESILGIVGVGNVGSRVDILARALGMQTLWCDPPRARAELPDRFVGLEDICARANVISFHVPLERRGPDATEHMIDAPLLTRIQPGAVVINTSRGAVHDTPALKRAKLSGHIGALVLDVFEGEPRIDPELVELAEIATPHIAGYSYDGKVAGTRMIFESACRFLGSGATWPKGIPPSEDLHVALEEPQIRRAVFASYNIDADNSRVREAMRVDGEDQRAQGFDRLRKEYPRRREFSNWRVALGPRASAVRPTLKALGFDCVIISH